MKIITKTLVLAGSVATAAALASPASAATFQSGASYSSGSTQGVVFVQNDAVAGNTVVAYERTSSGGLTKVGSYPTGGDGGVLSGSVVDHLAIQLAGWATRPSRRRSARCC